ncbi:hypothetical protein [Actinopolymorpha pittospori]
MRVPLVLTGPPAVGKTTAGRALAASRRQGAYVDVDDIRHLVVAGHAAPWHGPEGIRQQLLGVRNACLLARQLGAAGFSTVVADVVTARTLAVYRELLPGCLVLRLRVSPEEARRRAATRPMHLTPAEFERLHAEDAATRLDVDMELDATDLPLRRLVEELAAMWSAR